MFGYVIVNKDELKFKEFDIYQSFYCGLCKQLHRDFGRFGQMSLNFDMTFLTIVLSGLYEPKDIVEQERCVMHPLHKHTSRVNDYSKYGADMTILLTYLKCEDDWQDDHSYRSLAFQSILKKRYESMQTRYPEKVKAIGDALREISECEQASIYDLDRLANLFGIVLGEIFAYRDDVWRDKLYQMGNYLGRYIYLMDAYDDIEEDEKLGHYNPLAQALKRDDFEEWIKEVLELMLAQSCTAFESLPILEYASIIRNVLYSGVWSKYETTKKKRSGEQNGSI